jgi:hypothetical protein
MEFQMTYFRELVLTLPIAAVVFAGPVYAEMVTFNSTLQASQEVPPTTSTGKGTASLSVDTNSKQATWKITYDGLTGDVVAAHFHGPAEPGKNAGPVIDISSAIKEGTATLTDQQLADLQAGLWYVNIHTAKFPDGEIRGQVQK